MPPSPKNKDILFQNDSIIIIPEEFNTVDQQYWYHLEAHQKHKILGPTPDLPYQNSYFKKIPKRSICTLELEKY